MVMIYAILVNIQTKTAFHQVTYEQLSQQGQKCHSNRKLDGT